MSKRNIFFIIVILILVLGLVFWIFFLPNNAETGESNLSIKDFFPFGKSTDTETNTPTVNTNEENLPEVEQGLPKLRKISENPISGFINFETNGENFVRFVDRATGHIWEASTEFKGAQRLTNTTVAQTQESIWASKNAVFLRYLREDEETIETVLLRILPPGSSDNLVFSFDNDLKLGDNSADVLNLQIVLNKDEETRVSDTGIGSTGQETTYFGTKTETAVKKFQSKYAEEILTPQELIESTGIVDELTRNKLNEITGANSKIETVDEDSNLYETILTFLPSDIKQLVFLDKLQKIFFLQEDRLGSVGTLAEIDGNIKTQIFDSPAREWGVNSGSGDFITLATKTSNSYLGVLYQLNKNGNSEKILGNLNGLSGLTNYDTTKILYSNTSGDFALKILDRSTNEVTNVFLQTLPEKCVWSQKEPAIYCAVPKIISLSKYPDDWYQGTFSPSDLIWKINTDTGESDLITDNSQFDGIDAINPTLNSNEQYLFFTNKKDYSLWSLRLFESAPDVAEEEVATTTTEQI